jgi:hypothetical protein
MSDWNVLIKGDVALQRVASVACSEVFAQIMLSGFEDCLDCLLKERHSHGDPRNWRIVGPTEKLKRWSFLTESGVHPITFDCNGDLRIAMQIDGLYPSFIRVNWSEKIWRRCTHVLEVDYQVSPERIIASARVIETDSLVPDRGYRIEMTRTRDGVLVEGSAGYLSNRLTGETLVELVNQTTGWHPTEARWNDPSSNRPSLTSNVEAKRSDWFPPRSAWSKPTQSSDEILRLHAESMMTTCTSDTTRIHLSKRLGIGVVQTAVCTTYVVGDFVGTAGKRQPIFSIPGTHLEWLMAEAKKASDPKLRVTMGYYYSIETQSLPVFFVVGGSHRRAVVLQLIWLSSRDDDRQWLFDFFDHSLPDMGISELFATSATIFAAGNSSALNDLTFGGMILPDGVIKPSLNYAFRGATTKSWTEGALRVPTPSDFSGSNFLHDSTPGGGWYGELD